MKVNLDIMSLGNHGLPTPSVATMGSAGIDLAVRHEATIPPGEHRLVMTGFAMAIPVGYVGLVCPRSGLALKQGVTVLNAPGVIDSDYRGEVGVILYNASNLDVKFDKGDRIAQLVITPVAIPFIKQVDELSGTLRGEGGFGSTGVAG